MAEYYDKESGEKLYPTIQAKHMLLREYLEETEAIFFKDSELRLVMKYRKDIRIVTN